MGHYTGSTKLAAWKGWKAELKHFKLKQANHIPLASAHSLMQTMKPSQTPA